MTSTETVTITLSSEDEIFSLQEAIIPRIRELIELTWFRDAENLITTLSQFEPKASGRSRRPRGCAAS